MVPRRAQPRLVYPAERERPLGKELQPDATHEAETTVERRMGLGSPRSGVDGGPASRTSNRSRNRLGPRRRQQRSFRNRLAAHIARHATDVSLARATRSRSGAACRGALSFLATGRQLAESPILDTLPGIWYHQRQPALIYIAGDVGSEQLKYGIPTLVSGGHRWNVCSVCRSLESASLHQFPYAAFATRLCGDGVAPFPGVRGLPLIRPTSAGAPGLLSAGSSYCADLDRGLYSAGWRIAIWRFQRNSGTMGW